LRVLGEPDLAHGPSAEALDQTVVRDLSWGDAELHEAWMPDDPHEGPAREHVSLTRLRRTPRGLSTPDPTPPRNHRGERLHPEDAPAVEARLRTRGFDGAAGKRTA